MSPVLTGQVDVVTGWLTNTRRMKVLGPDAGRRCGCGTPACGSTRCLTMRPRTRSRRAATCLAEVPAAIGEGATPMPRQPRHGGRPAGKEYPKSQARRRRRRLDAMMGYAFNDQTKANGWGAMDPQGLAGPDLALPSSGSSRSTHAQARGSDDDGDPKRDPRRAREVSDDPQCLLPDGTRHDIDLKDGRIAAFLPPSPGEALGLVLPPLVDGHIHLDKTLLGLPWLPNQAEGNGVADRIEAERKVRARAQRLRDRDRRQSREAGGGQRHPAHALPRRHRQPARPQEPARYARGARAVPRPRHHRDRGLPPERHRPLARHGRAAGRGDRGGRRSGRRPRSGRHRRRPRRPSRRDVRASRAGAASASTSICTTVAKAASREIGAIAERTKARGLNGKVAISHAFALGSVPIDLAERTADAPGRGGRGHHEPRPRRGRHAAGQAAARAWRRGVQRIGQHPRCLVAVRQRRHAGARHDGRLSRQFPARPRACVRLRDGDRGRLPACSASRTTDSRSAVRRIWSWSTPPRSPKRWPLALGARW